MVSSIAFKFSEIRNTIELFTVTPTTQDYLLSGLADLEKYCETAIATERDKANRLANTSTELSDARKSLEKLKADLKVIGNERSQAQTDLVGTRSQLATTKTGLVNTKTDLVKAQTKLATAKASLTTIEAELAVTRTKWSTTESALEARITEIELKNRKYEAEIAGLRHIYRMWEARYEDGITSNTTTKSNKRRRVEVEEEATADKTDKATSTAGPTIPESRAE